NLIRFDLDRHELTPVSWPPDLVATHDATSHVTAIAGLQARLFMADTIDSKTPALVISAPKMHRVAGPGTLTVLPDAADPGRAVIVVFDRDRLLHEVVEPLAAKYFGAPPDSEFVISVVRRDDGQVVFPPTEGTVKVAQGSSAAIVDRAGADAV